MAVEKLTKKKKNNRPVIADDLGPDDVEFGFTLAGELLQPVENEDILVNGEMGEI